MRGLHNILVTCLLAGALVAVPRANPEVVITDLGTVGDGNWSSAGAINRLGQVVGWAYVGGPFTLQRAILWDNGVATQLGALCEECGSVALDINDSTEVVGVALMPTGASAFVWRDGVMTELPPLAGDTFGIAQSINNLGDIVGWSSGPNGSHAVMWHNNVPQDLGIGSAQAWANNDAGDIVGQMTAASGQLRAFLVRNGILTDLGAAPSFTCPQSSGAFGINESDQIVGVAHVDCNPRPVMWINGVMQFLPPFDPAEPSGSALDINERGDIVGYSGILRPMAQAVLWRNGTAMYLGSLAGPTVRSLASDINDHGLIVGSSTISTDVVLDHAVTYRVVESPSEQLASLITKVEGKGPGESLHSKLLSAQIYLDAGNTADACDTLRAFIREVDAQRGKKLTAPEADSLMQAAEAIRSASGC